MNYSSLYTQKDLMQKVKPRHTGGYRLDLQINNVRKTFYSSKAGDVGRRECAKKALAWIGGSSAKKSYTITTDKIFQDFSMTKKLSPMISTISKIITKITFSPSSVKSPFFL